MEIQLEHKKTFQVIGFSVTIRPEEERVKTAQFWDEEYTKRFGHLWLTGQPETEAEHAVIVHMIGRITLKIPGDDAIEYMIGGLYQGGRIPAGMKVVSVPEGDWVVFSAKSPTPDVFYELNTAIREQWLPTEGKAYEIGGAPTVEICHIDPLDATNMTASVWLPLRKA